MPGAAAGSGELLELMRRARGKAEFAAGRLSGQALQFAQRFGEQISVVLILLDRSAGALDQVSKCRIQLEFMTHLIEQGGLDKEAQGLGARKAAIPGAEGFQLGGQASQRGRAGAGTRCRGFVRRINRSGLPWQRVPRLRQLHLEQAQRLDKGRNGGCHGGRRAGALWPARGDLEQGRPGRLQSLLIASYRAAPTTP